MPSTLVTGIAELTTNDDAVGRLAEAAVVLDGGVVAWVGPSAEAPAADARVDVAGRAVLPGWVDSHSHVVFAGDRAAEFSARMAGQPYRAGGMQSTVAATRAATDDVLLANVRLTDEDKDHEADLVVLMPGFGCLVLEVKGGSVWHDDDGWWVRRGGRPERAGPVDQARDVARQLPGRTVWAIDADGLVVRPGPRLVDGVEAIAAVLHPDAVPPSAGERCGDEALAAEAVPR